MIPFLDSNEAGPHDRMRTPLVLEMNLALGNFYLFSHRYDKAEAYAKKLHFNLNDLIALKHEPKYEQFRSRMNSIMGRYWRSIATF